MSESEESGRTGKNPNAVKAFGRLLDQAIGRWCKERKLSRSVLANKIGVTEKALQNWTRGRNLPRVNKWGSAYDQLAAEGSGSTSSEIAALDLAWKVATEDDSPIESPTSRCTSSSTPAGTPEAADATPLGSSTPITLRFQADLTDPQPMMPDHWFRLILHDAPAYAANQLIFSIDYRPYPVSLTGKTTSAPFRFLVKLPEVQVIADWSVVTAVKGSIQTNDQVSYAMGWRVKLPQDANQMALDNFVAAALQAREVGARLPLNAYARREEIDVNRLDGGAMHRNREAVIAQAVRVLGFDGDAEHAQLAVGALVAMDESSQ